MRAYSATGEVAQPGLGSDSGAGDPICILGSAGLEDSERSLGNLDGREPTLRKQQQESRI